MTKSQSYETNISYCVNCKHWEPIPFHNNGGVCTAKKYIKAPRITSVKAHLKGSLFISKNRHRRTYTGTTNTEAHSTIRSST